MVMILMFCQSIVLSHGLDFIDHVFSCVMVFFMTLCCTFYAILFSELDPFSSYLGDAENGVSCKNNLES